MVQVNSNYSLVNAMDRICVFLKFSLSCYLASFNKKTAVMGVDNYPQMWTLLLRPRIGECAQSKMICKYCLKLDWIFELVMMWNLISVFCLSGLYTNWLSWNQVSVWSKWLFICGIFYSRQNTASLSDSSDLQLKNNSYAFIRMNRIFEFLN